MAISNPNHWMEDYKFKGPKYDKIVEIIAALNTLEDHGNLAGLADDDHTHYLNIARHDLTARHGSAVVDHGGIGGLGDDDHSQYLNIARHDLTARHGAAVVDHGGIGGLGDDDHSQYFKVIGRNNEDLTFVGTGKISSPDADTVHYLGRAAIGYNGLNSNFAVFAHRDKMTGFNYALLQRSTGLVSLNAPTGSVVDIRNNSAIIASFNPSGMSFVAGNRINEFSIDGTLAGNSDAAIPTEKAIKTYVDAHAISGKVFIPGSNFVPGPNSPMSSDGVNTYIADTFDTYIQGFLPLPSQITIGGTVKYLKITTVRVNWNQNNAGDDLNRFWMRRFISGTGTGQTCLDDGTNRGAAGYNNYSYSITVNNTLDATYDIFSIIIYYIKSAGGAATTDWRFQGCMVTYEYV